MDESKLLILFLLLVFGYFVLYFKERKYLENFSERFDKDGTPKNNLNMTTYPPEMHYVDNYELSHVYQNQASKEASKKQISDAMTRYPLDWSVQGPDSQYFQDNQVEYENKPMYAEEDEILPDIKTMDDEELKILQTYVPESSKGLLEYCVDDVKILLEKLYLKKGLIPLIEKSKQGSNVWEIVEVKDKDPVIVWEERTTMNARGEEAIDVPYTVSDVAAGLDPFRARSSDRNAKYDINSSVGEIRGN